MKTSKIQKTRRLPDYADSIAQAASMLSEAGTPCTAGDLKRAKRDGCKAFKGSRVYFEPLEEWLASALPEETSEELESKDTLERRRLHEQVLKIRHSRYVEEGRYILKEDDRRNTIAAVAEFRAALEAFSGEAPAWAGLDPAEIQTRLRARIEDILSELHVSFSRLNA